MAASDVSVAVEARGGSKQPSDVPAAEGKAKNRAASCAGRIAKTSRECLKCGSPLLVPSTPQSHTPGNDSPGLDSLVLEGVAKKECGRQRPGIQGPTPPDHFRRGFCQSCFAAKIIQKAEIPRGLLPVGHKSNRKARRVLALILGSRGPDVASAALIKVLAARKVTATLFAPFLLTPQSLAPYLNKAPACDVDLDSDQRRNGEIDGTCTDHLDFDELRIPQDCRERLVKLSECFGEASILFALSLRVAKREDFAVLTLPSCATEIAGGALTDFFSGVAGADLVADGIEIRRPLGAFTQKELEGFVDEDSPPISCENNLGGRSVPLVHSPAKALDRLTADFLIKTLQSFPSAIPNICHLATAPTLRASETLAGSTLLRPSEGEHCGLCYRRIPIPLDDSFLLPFRGLNLLTPIHAQAPTHCPELQTTTGDISFCFRCRSAAAGHERKLRSAAREIEDIAHAAHAPHHGG